MAGVHSSLGPSSAHRFTRCTAAPLAEAAVHEPEEPSFYASEGTIFHEVAALCVEFGLEPEDFFGLEMIADGMLIEVDAEMVRYMRPGLEIIRELPEPWYIEQWVETSHYLGEGQGGTLDHGAVNWIDRTIYVFDWKYGQGIRVYADENEQLMLYVCGFWKTFIEPEAIRRGFSTNIEDWNVVIHIEQPRILQGGGSWHTSLARCIEFAQFAGEKASETRTNPTFSPGESQCFFCKARKSEAGCDANTQYVFDIVGLAFDDIDAGISEGTPPVVQPSRLLTPERRAYIVQHASMVEKFLKEVHKTVLTDALSGRPTPGLKAVAGKQPPRKYREGSTEAVEELLVRALGEEGAYQKKLWSPTQAEIKLGPAGYAELEKHVDRGQAKVSLVPEDSRKEALATFEDQFTDDDV
jgi:hypothetical protein